MDFNMHGRNAAIIADGAYAVAAANSSTSRDVQADAQMAAEREPIFAGNSEGPNLSVPVRPMEAVISQSGVVVRETAGFGVLLERKGGQKGEYIMAMRGTVGTIGISSDWQSNLNIGMTRGPTGSLVHSGFMDIYKKMQSDVQSMIKKAKPSRVHFIGHSLGGALATLSAIDFAQNGTATSHLYTFGAPRIGSLGLCSDVERYIGPRRVKRVYSISDPVPMIPMFPFCHVGPGSIGLNQHMTIITAEAHSMKNNYVRELAKYSTGWPPETRLAMRIDPGYWLTKAEGYGVMGSGMGYFFLAKALRAILYLGANMISAAFTVGFTLIDMLAALIQKSVQIGSKIADYMVRFVKAALRLAGVAVRAATVTAADLTAAFLRYVLDLLTRPIIVAAKAASKFVT